MVLSINTVTPRTVTVQPAHAWACWLSSATNRDKAPSQTSHS